MKHGFETNWVVVKNARVVAVIEDEDYRNAKLRAKVRGYEGELMELAVPASEDTPADYVFRGDPVDVEEWAGDRYAYPVF